MINIIRIIKSYPLTLLTVILIWYLCFCTPPSTKLNHVIGIDKVVHFGMYAFLTIVLLFEEAKAKGLWMKDDGLCAFMIHKFSIGYLFFTLISPILMSGLIEILQETCTGGRRSGDIWDFVANSLGAIAAWLLWRFWVSRKFVG